MRGTDGRFYGPADLPMLNQWATEGRVLADSMLVDSVTNQQSLARDTPGLQHHFQLSPRPQQHQPYQAPQAFQQGQQRPQGQWQYPPQPGGAPTPYSQPHTPYSFYPRKSKLAAALLAFFLGGFGIHRFYLGYTTIGFVQLAITVLGTWLCCVGWIIGGLWALVDFVMILIDALPDAHGQRLD